MEIFCKHYANKVLIMRFVCFWAAGLVMLSTWSLGCTPSTNIGVKVKRNRGTAQPVIVDGHLEFKIDRRWTNGLIRLKIMDVSDGVAAGKVVWNLGANYFPGSRIKYGVVPRQFKIHNGEVRDASQQFPLKGVPSDLVEGKVYLLYADWQFDSFTAATGDTISYFKIHNKQIVMVEEPKPASPKKPSEADIER